MSQLTVSESNSKNEAFIQKKIESFKGGALIGVEYALEIYERLGGICRYRCILCDLLTRNILSHFMSYNHRIRYLQKHYPTVLSTYRLFTHDRNTNKESRIVVQIMAEAIENYYGWLPVKSISEEDFHCNPQRASEDVLNSFHYDENMGPDFLDVVAESFQKKFKMHYSANNHCANNLKYKLNHKFFVKNADNRVIASRHKWEKYHSLLQERIMIIEALQAEYDKSPESHPFYSDEWDMFWVRRYKQLKLENKTDPKTYDYKPEWVIYWSRRMKELSNKEIEKAKSDIKLSLGIPEVAEDPDEHYHPTPESLILNVIEAQNQTFDDFMYSTSRNRNLSPSPFKRNPQKHEYSRSRSRSPLHLQNRRTHSHITSQQYYGQKEDEVTINSASSDENHIVPHYLHRTKAKYTQEEFIGPNREQPEHSASGRIPYISEDKLGDILDKSREIRTLAVIDRSVNDCGISQMNWKKLENPLTDALVEVLKRNHGPVAQFRDAGWYQGRIKLIEFKDNRSPNLYREALRTLGQIWPSARLDLTDLSEIPSRPRAYIKVPANPSRPCEILAIIQQSNVELPTYNWKIQKVSFDKGGFRQVNLTINGKSTLLLRERNGIIHYGSEKIQIRIFKEDI